MRVRAGEPETVRVHLRVREVVQGESDLAEAGRTPSQSRVPDHTGSRAPSPGDQEPAGL